jgi:hypothetical protein
LRGRNLSLPFWTGSGWLAADWEATNHPGTSIASQVSSVGPLATFLDPFAAFGSFDVALCSVTNAYTLTPTPL